MAVKKASIATSSPIQEFQDEDTSWFLTSVSISHSLPLNPTKQEQLKDPYVLTQRPSLKQGLSTHSSTSIMHLKTNMLCQTYLDKYYDMFIRMIKTKDLSPLNPGSHSQMGPSRPSIHCPPFWHGFSLQYGPIWHLQSHKEFWAYINSVRYYNQKFTVHWKCSTFDLSTGPCIYSSTPGYSGCRSLHTGRGWSHKDRSWPHNEFQRIKCCIYRRNLWEYQWLSNIINQLI